MDEPLEDMCGWKQVWVVRLGRREDDGPVPMLAIYDHESGATACAQSMNRLRGDGECWAERWTVQRSSIATPAL